MKPLWAAIVGYYRAGASLQEIINLTCMQPDNIEKILEFHFGKTLLDDYLNTIPISNTEEKIKTLRFILN